MNNESLENAAERRKIRVFEPLAKYLNSQSALFDFEISLLDCYRLAGHACPSITGAFLVTEAAVRILFPETKTCERGDLRVEFAQSVHEAAAGPRSNVISYITGAWADSGFSGLQGKFKRRNLLSYGHADVPTDAIRFTRISTGNSLVIEFDPDTLTEDRPPNEFFADTWRKEIQNILKSSDLTLKIQSIALSPTCDTSAGANGCC